MRKLFLLIAIIIISGCTSQFAYRHLDWIIVWYSNDYLDLNHQQNEQFTQAVKATLRWHRQSELPKYKNQLLNIASDLQSLPLSTPQVERHGRRLQAYWRNLRLHISNEFSPLANQLNDDQIVYLFERLERKNQTRLNDLTEQSLAQKHQDQLEKWQEILTDLLGDLTPVQMDLVESFIASREDTTTLRVEYLQTYQAKLKQVLLTSANTAEIQMLLNEPESFKSKAYLDLQQKNRERIFRLIRDLSVHLTPEQIHHLDSIIQDYIEFIDEMIQS